MIQEFKKEGKLVPSEVVVKLLKQAMQRSGNRKFLIDGFPRNEENRLTAEKMVPGFFCLFIRLKASTCFIWLFVLIVIFTLSYSWEYSQQ